MAYGLYHGGLHTATTLKPGMSTAQGVILEMILTCQLCFTVLMLAAEKHEATFLAPLGIGLSVFIGELAGKLSQFSPKLPIKLSLTQVRRLLDRRFHEPGPLPWPRSHNQKFPNLPLDLLGWTHRRRRPSKCHLQTNQSTRIRNRAAFRGRIACSTYSRFGEGNGAYGSL